MKYLIVLIILIYLQQPHLVIVERFYKVVELKIVFQFQIHL